jgi:hypothetical protein
MHKLCSIETKEENSIVGILQENLPHPWVYVGGTGLYGIFAIVAAHIRK